MTNLLEDPTPIILAGIAIEALLGIALVVSGRGVLLAPMGVVAVVCLGGVGVEWLVETDREQVEGVIEAGRAAVERNDFQAALELVAPSAAEVRRDVERGFVEATFHEIKVRALKITIDGAANPTRARAEFTVIAAFDSRRGTIPYRNFVAAVSVALERFGQRWLVTEIRDVKPGLKQ